MFEHITGIYWLFWHAADIGAALWLQVKPTHILNAAGITGRPNVDWCEDHKVSLQLGAQTPNAVGAHRA